jgi:hypothetical protein
VTFIQHLFDGQFYLIILTTIIWFKTELQQTHYRIAIMTVQFYMKNQWNIKKKKRIVFNVKKNTMVTAREGQKPVYPR